MGVLDDAIREHLDLKRRHGAAEHEVKRQEEEALGPVRREVEGADAGENGEPGEEAVGDEALPEPLEEQSLEEERPEALIEEAEPLQPFDHEADAGPAPIEAVPQAPEPAPPPAEWLDDEDRGTEPAAEPEPQGEAPGPEPPDEPRALVDEHVSSVAPQDEADERPPRPERGDMLEETPDFLQETPEHDRLWFEQKPPRDFDFD